MIEKQVEVRAMKLSDVMSFTKGATYNMRVEECLIESEDEPEGASRQTQKSIPREQGGDKEGETARAIKVQPAVALKRSQRLASRDDQGLSIQ